MNHKKTGPLTPDEQAIQDFEFGWVNGSHVGFAQKKALFAIKNRMGFVISGKSGVGKSATAAHIKSKITAQSTKLQTMHGVIAVELESSTTVQEMIYDLLSALGIEDDDIPIRERSSKKLKKLLYKQIIACGVILINVDEFQHLLRQGKKAQNSRVVDFLKVLLGATGVSIGLFGIEKDVRLLDFNDQFETRFTEPVVLEALCLDADGEPGYFQWFLGELVKQFPRKSKNFATRDNALRFLMVSEGNLRNLKNILVAVCRASAPDQTVTMKDVEAAFAMIKHGAVYRGRNGREIFPFRSDAHIIQRYLQDGAGS